MSESKTAEEKSEDRLETCVGIAVVLLATFLGLCNVKDNNIVQKMQIKQVDRNNQWSWYQARNVRMAVYQATADKLSVPQPNETSEAKLAREELAKAYQKEANDQDKKMKTQEAEAKTAHEEFLVASAKDDQFDLSEAALAISLAMMGVTALIKRWWLFWIAMVPAVFGFFMGLAGFAGMDTNSPLIQPLIDFLT